MGYAQANAGIRVAVKRLWPRLFEPVDSASLVFFRMVFGLLMLVEVFRYLDYGWIARYFIRPQVLFTYPGFDWVQPWPGDGMYYHFYVLGLAALGMMCGF